MPCHIHLTLLADRSDEIVVLTLAVYRRVSVRVKPKVFQFHRQHDRRASRRVPSLRQGKCCLFQVGAELVIDIWRCKRAAHGFTPERLRRRFAGNEVCSIDCSHWRSEAKL
jgi:hypothetical protein